MAGLQAAVARMDAQGDPPGGWRPVPVALACFTSGAAYAAFQEEETGRIVAGMRADLTVLNANPLAVPAAELAAVQVLRTVVGGRTVYRREEP